MKIQADQPAREVLTRVCAAALKGRDIEILREVNTVLTITQLFPEPSKEEEKCSEE